MPMPPHQRLALRPTAVFVIADLAQLLDDDLKRRRRRVVATTRAISSLPANWRVRSSKAGSESAAVA
ncbi:hypothetical protein E2562_007760 [Oryza meyeriana var. granulata]|uniref:Uncharacterized protein n=1 Tax=Oryza meyeriana var. granulata TaxID=110450 RepID=A0A6G1EGN5_9ORYZ|nr:hypothetical protein E2562_007760 [Oryza meyeriana var. granulata]